MKKYNIVLSELFHKDIFIIEEVIFRYTFSKTTTINIINKIYSSIFGLSIFPNRFPFIKNNLRVMNIDSKYKVIYKVNEEKQEIEIYRILFSRSNYNNIF